MADMTMNNDVRAVAAFLDETFEKARKLQSGVQLPRSLWADWLETPVGDIYFIGDDDSLHFVGLVGEEASMLRKIALLQKHNKAFIKVGGAAAVAEAKRELSEYFAGSRRVFSVPLTLGGTAFQVKVWEAMREVPYGEAIGYAELAERIGNPSSFRAVAQASSQNPVAIIVPCHRVTSSAGGAGGNTVWIERKSQLLEFEKRMLANGR